MNQHIIIRKCWKCHNNLLTTEQIRTDKPCTDCQKKDPNFKLEERKKKTFNYLSYEEIQKRIGEKK